MRVYAAPLLSQEAGVQAILCQSQESFDCLSYYNHLHPDYSAVFGLLADLKRQAFSIYLDNTLFPGVCSSTTDMIDQFILAVQRFPKGSPGQHVLVWPVFIVASGSRQIEHQLFLKGFLEKQYRRNGFGNIPRALDLLQRIWTHGDPEKWPALLPEPQVFIM